ncbi:hypothetical protein Cgig2_013856 [Carnegiea gigantea]|uniref:Uncharacterized protein n=1 Tax=Carnegiea gigantea TaxID=171969 RepID=A0A9Q1KJV1_9CARY|nr:hypothetical protein Cgig2_013856 [Carnegiea gigantea]
MGAANSARPLPHFDYVPTTSCEPSHRKVCVLSPHYIEREREASRSNQSGRPYSGHHDRHAAAATRLSRRPIQGQTAKSATASTPFATHSRGHPMLQRPPPTTAPPKPQNTQKHCDFHEQNGHTTTECRELKKALHELADKEPAQPQPQEEEYLTEVMATIDVGYAEGMTRLAWKAQLRSTQEVLTTEQGARITVPTMVFAGKEALSFASPRNDPLVVEMKIASAIARNLEVDFLVVDVSTAYNVILEHPILHKVKATSSNFNLRLMTDATNTALPKKKKEQRKTRGLHIGLSTVLVTLIFRSLSISIQGVSHLIAWTITFTERRDNLDLLRVSTLSLGPLALVDIVEVGLEVANLLKFLGQRH